MKTLQEIWDITNYQLGTKVRWQDWGYNFRYFEIHAVSKSSLELIGVLDTGEQISYPLKSTNWSLYKPGDEFNAKAV